MDKNIDDFFNSLPKDEGEQQSAFEEPKAQPEAESDQNDKEPKADESKEEIRKKPTRSERRENKQTAWLTEQLQKEREDRIRLEERLNALASKSEVKPDPDITRLLTETKDPAEATKIFSDLMEKMRSDALKTAEERFKELSQKEQTEVDKQAAEINSELEEIEDKYDVDFSKGKLRNDFLDFVEKISPKNSDALPDLENAFQVFQSLQKPAAQNAAEKQQASNRSMTRSMSPNATGESPKNARKMSFDNLRDVWRSINK